MSKEALRDRDLTHGVEFTPAIRTTKPTYVSTKRVVKDIGPLAMFRFVYRSKVYLKDEGIMPGCIMPNLGQPGHTFPWVGPILVVAYRYQNFTGKPEDSDKHDWLDVTAGDFRSVVEYINTCKAHPCLTQTKLFPKAAHGHDGGLSLCGRIHRAYREDGGRSRAERAPEAQCIFGRYPPRRIRAPRGHWCF
ncbi:hypothetical protein F4778DRAFT_124358 [Xylariomycetidae sp. FL2044]|nr:hypothetical protein F4778DRAFT_124358 [Xylariomycetidae sp. FL2044]